MIISACVVSLCRIIALDSVDPEDITGKMAARNTHSRKALPRAGLCIANGHHHIGSNVSPSLWPAAEAQTLILSGNLPLMSPLFRRLGNLLGLRLHKIRVSKEGEEEESSNILELSDPTSGSNNNKNNKATTDNTKRIMGKSAFLGTSARHSAEPDGRMGTREELPNGQIMVDLDLEQNVHKYGTSSSNASRRSGTPNEEIGQV